MCLGSFYRAILYKLATHKKLKFLRVGWLDFTDQRTYFLVLNNIRWFNIDICYEISSDSFVFVVFVLRGFNKLT